jgi:RNA polymerase primary sigma factor
LGLGQQNCDSRKATAMMTEHPQRDWRIHEGWVVTKAQEDRLIRKAKGRKGVPPDERARRELVEYMRPFIAAEAKKQVGLGVDFDDLMREGEEAVLRALDAYTPQGWWFRSYARFWIHGRMRRAIANQALTIRVPEYRVLLAGKERQARERIAQEFGRTPTDFEVAREMNVPVEVVWDVAVETAPLESVEQIAEEAEEADSRPRNTRRRPMRASYLRDKTGEPERSLLRKELPEGVREALRTLESRDRLVFILRYAYGRSRREITEKTGLTAKAIRLSEWRARKALRGDKNLYYLWKFVWK